MNDRFDVRRLLLAASIVLQAIVLAFMSGRHAFAPFVTFLAVVGLLGPWRLRLRRPWAISLAAVLAVVFFIKASFTPVGDFPGSSDMFPYAYRYVVCQYALLIECCLLFLRRDDSAPWPLGFLLGVLVFVYAGFTIFAGGGLPQATTMRVYRTLGLIEGTVLVLMVSVGIRRTRGWEPEATRGRRLVWQSGVVLASVALGWAGGEMALALNDYAASTLERLNVQRSYGRSAQGFTRNSWLGSIAHWKGRASDEVALRVVSRHAPGYLRGAVFATYDSKPRQGWDSPGRSANVSPISEAPAWIRLEAEGQSVFRIETGEAPPVVSRDGLRVLEVHQAGEAADALFAPYGTQWVAARVSRLQVDHYGCLSLQALPAGGRYRVYAAVDPPIEPLSERDRTEALEVDAKLRERLQGIAESIVGDAESNAEKINLVVRFFRENFTYRFGIDVPKEARDDPLTWFITTRPPAHCEYFATGAAILLRLVGVPTRFVSGFVAEERNPLGDYWVARNRDAHAWVEAWDPKRGWVLAEATPPQGVPGWTGGEKDSQWKWFLDAARHRLSQWWAAIASGGLKRAAAAWVASLLDRWREMSIAMRVAGSVLAAAIAAGWWAWRRRRALASAPRRARQTAAFRDLLRRMDHRLARRGLRRAPAETLHRFAGRVRIARPEGVDAELAARWYESYATMRYTGRIDHDSRRELERRLPK